MHAALTKHGRLAGCLGVLASFSLLCENTLAKTAERGRRDTRLLVQVACARVCLSPSLTLTLEVICVYLKEESARTLKLQEAQIQLNSLEKYLKRIGIKKKLGELFKDNGRGGLLPLQRLGLPFT